MTLLQVIEHFISAGSITGTASSHKLVYMRRQFSGQELQATTLQSIGLSSGSALFRCTPTKAVAAVAATPATALAPEAKTNDPSASDAAASEIQQPPATTANATTVTEGAVAATAVVRQEQQQGQKQQPQQSEKESETAASSTAPPPASPADSAPPPSSAPPTVASSSPSPAAVDVGLSECEASIAMLRQACWDSDAQIAILTLCKLLATVINSPGGGKGRDVRTGNQLFHSRVGRFNGGTRFLRSLGFQVHADGELCVPPPPSLLPSHHLVLSREAERRALSPLTSLPSSTTATATAAAPGEGAAPSLLRAAYALLLDSARELGVAQGKLPTLRTPRQLRQAAAAAESKAAAAQAFDPFKSNVQRMVPQPRGRGVAAATAASSTGGAEEKSGRPASTAAAAATVVLSETEAKVAALAARQQAVMAEAQQPPPRELQFMLPQRRARKAMAAAGASSAGAAGGAGESKGGGGGSSPEARRREEEAGVPLSVIAARRWNEAQARSERSEASLVMDSMKRRRLEQEKGKTLRTKAMRDLEALQKVKVFSRTLIRVQLPDGVVMQAQFSPSEPLSAVLYLLRSVLAPGHPALDQDDAAELYLYVSPPKQVLKPQLSLAAQQLQPAALVYMGCPAHTRFKAAQQQLLAATAEPAAAAAAAAATLQPGWYLKQEVRGSEAFLPVAASVAGDAAASAAVPSSALPRGVPLVEQPQAPGATDQAGIESCAPPRKKKSSLKKPKWFKL